MRPCRRSRRMPDFSARSDGLPVMHRTMHGPRRGMVERGPRRYRHPSSQGLTAVALQVRPIGRKQPRRPEQMSDHLRAPTSRAINYGNRCRYRLLRRNSRSKVGASPSRLRERASMQQSATRCMNAISSTAGWSVYLLVMRRPICALRIASQASKSRPSTTERRTSAWIVVPLVSAEN